MLQVVRLPEGGVAEFEVKLNAKGSLPLGRKEIELPLEGTSIHHVAHALPSTASLQVDS